MQPVVTSGLVISAIFYFFFPYSPNHLSIIALCKRLKIHVQSACRQVKTRIELKEQVRQYLRVGTRQTGLEPVQGPGLRRFARQSIPEANGMREEGIPVNCRSSMWHQEPHRMTPSPPRCRAQIGFRWNVHKAIDNPVEHGDLSSISASLE